MISPRNLKTVDSHVTEPSLPLFKEIENLETVLPTQPLNLLVVLETKTIDMREDIFEVRNEAIHNTSHIDATVCDFMFFRNTLRSPL